MGCQGVVAVGGGSAIDCGKAVAALLGNGGADPFEHLEVVGRGRPLARPSLPFVAVPTTAGTGSEVTRNAVLGAAGTKASLRSPFLLPRLARGRPGPARGRAARGAGAERPGRAAQLIEPYLSVARQPADRRVRRRGHPPLGAIAARRLPARGSTPPRREDLALASLLGGLCLANAGLGAVHGFASPGRRPPWGRPTGRSAPRCWRRA